MCVCMCGIIVRSEHNLSLALSNTAPLSPHCDFIFISACGNFISSTPLSSFASDAQFSPWGRKEKSSLVLNIWVQCIPHLVLDNIQPAICFSLYHRICFFFLSQMSSFVQNFPFSYFPYILFQIISLLAWQEASADELEAISWSFEFNFNFTNSPRLDQTLDSLLSLVELPPKMDFTLK